MNYQQVYYERLSRNNRLNDLQSRQCSFAKTLTVNGVIFSKELWLPDFSENGPKIYEIIDTFFTELSDINKIWVVCKVYQKVTYEQHYNCYMVHMNSLQEDLLIVNISEYLMQHLYPVKIHLIQDKNLFRLKRFWKIKYCNKCTEDVIEYNFNSLLQLARHGVKLSLKPKSYPKRVFLTI